LHGYLVNGRLKQLLYGLPLPWLE